MTWAYSSRSLDRLNSCHPDLILLMTEALADPACPSDISILEGYRDEQKQNELKASGASQLSWPNSYHNRFPSMAVDVAPYVGGISWDWQYYYPLAAHIKAVWSRLHIERNVSADHYLEWGDDWTSFKDGPHWQLVAIDG
jgi:peptidoglycan L-alanyl-D-glutamate endopeptidase CwlK